MLLFIVVSNTPTVTVTYIIVPKCPPVPVTAYYSVKHSNCYCYCVLECQTVQLLLLLDIVVPKCPPFTVTVYYNAKQSSYYCYCVL